MTDIPPVGQGAIHITAVGRLWQRQRSALDEHARRTARQLYVGRYLHLDQRPVEREDKPAIGFAADYDASLERGDLGPLDAELFGGSVPGTLGSFLSRCGVRSIRCPHRGKCRCRPLHTLAIDFENAEQNPAVAARDPI